MAKYITKFNNLSEYNEALTGLDFPNVSYLVTENEIKWAKTATPPVHDYSADYLTFVAEEDGTFSYSNPNGYSITNYSVDEGQTWTRLGSGVDTPLVTAGSKILWKGPVSLGMDGLDGFHWGTFSSSGRFSVEGNVLSLLYGDDFANRSMPTDYGSLFSSLFQDCVYLTSAAHLALTSMELPNNCYDSMFRGCDMLTTVPELPATTLANYCYSHMFERCFSLTTAPVLPAETLAENCYSEMFADCTSLTTAPELPATTLANSCYSHMFEHCSSLTTAPVLPAETLADSCYSEMFADCFNLNSVTCYATTNENGDASLRAYGWLRGVASEGTFTKGNVGHWGECDDSGIPCGWTVIQPPCNGVIDYDIAAGADLTCVDLSEYTYVNEFGEEEHGEPCGYIVDRLVKVTINRDTTPKDVFTSAAPLVIHANGGALGLFYDSEAEAWHYDDGATGENGYIEDWDENGNKTFSVYDISACPNMENRARFEWVADEQYAYENNFPIPLHVKLYIVP